MTPPEVPATPDELAAGYLRGRDLPCPGCQYNRRDGATAACAECGHLLALHPSSEAHLDLVKEFASMVTAASTMLIILATVIFYQEARQSWMSGDSAIAACAFIPVVACGLYACFQAARATNLGGSIPKLRMACRMTGVTFCLFIVQLLIAGIAS